MVGALILGALPEIFRPIVNYCFLVFMILLLLMIRFQPAGLLGEKSALRRVLAPVITGKKPS